MLLRAANKGCDFILDIFECSQMCMQVCMSGFLI